MQIIFFKKQFKIVYIIYIKIKHLDEIFLNALCAQIIIDMKLTFNSKNMPKGCVFVIVFGNLWA